MTRRRLLLIALVLSLLLHLALLGSDLLPAISAPPAEEPKLEKIDVKMQAMRLDEPAAPPKPATAGVSLPPAEAPTPKSKPKPKPARKREASKPVEQAKPASAPTAEASASRASSAPAAEIASAAETSRAASAPAASVPPSKDSADNAGFLHPDTPQRQFPAAAQIRYQGYWGSAMVGFGNLDWQRDQGHYRLDITVSPIIGPKLRYLAQGTIDKSGLRPDSIQSFRGGDLKEAARFDYEAGLLRYGGSEDKQLPLKPGAQDAFSLAFQLALKGGDLGSAPIQITTAKKVYEYPMAPAGAFDYDTGAGKMRVIVFRAQGDGDVTEFWLAPDFANLPVRILRADKDKRIELKAIRIDVNGKRQWELPPQPTIRNKNAH
ncbi:DUF3108 domain-containing protein [Chromobacterium sp. ATCC 53434]|uniref:DUF3108 domain-containing protein n=1 Tax=Chromobacterium sp. (strain ATCC 53434 / SC 14030) TaxID=2059672 RepID=UPI000C7917A7|nr:DUF3108 domain-containing protein [Chromobacterium sp. ATCC 53434]AUH49926.1 DUF3108 domain-containing protein [Chromobacterium sp. ATCC 53434]